MEDLFEQFIRDRRYTKGVSSRTEGWYRQSWEAFREPLSGATPESLGKSLFAPTIETLLRRGVSPITVNTYSRAINAFLRWLSQEGHCSKPVRIERLKEPETVVLCYRPDHVQRLMRYRPRHQTEKRAWMMALLVLDTGMRLKEVLSLHAEDVNLDQRLVTVRDGKGGKQRIVPISGELRKMLFKYLAAKSSGLLFGTRNGFKLLQNNVRRDLGALCGRLKISGVKGGYHVLRHTFALSYVRNGGDVFRLQRILGHSTLDMTRRYVNLQTEDLLDVHDRMSPLSRG